MRRLFGWWALALAGAVVGVLTFGVLFASGQAGEHGIGFSKGCLGTTKIGDPYVCTYTIRNNSDDFGDDLTATSLVDNVFAFDGTKTSTNILHDGRLVLREGSGVCTGGTGSGTLADPWVNSTSCLLHNGARIGVVPEGFSFYTVQAGDFAANPLHLLADQAVMTWQDLCTSGAPNCPIVDQRATAGSSTTVQQLTSSTATEIHDAAHVVVTAVGVGATVHDFVAVTGESGKPTPSGSVTVDWFLNGDCSGTPAATGGPFALDASGQVDATSFEFTVNTAGHRAFRAHYAGDPTYEPSDGPCEPLAVVDANIQITPPTATNPVGTNHVFTAHVNVNDGSGFVDAPVGTQITFTIDSGPGAFTTSNPCTVAGGGSCQIMLTSAEAGTTTVSAHVTISVGGVSLTRDTDGTGANSGPATKLWADAVVRTDVHGASHTVITTAAAGDSVHDKVFVARTAATPAAVPNPTGAVVSHRYTTLDCTGTAVDETVAIAADGTAESASYTVVGNTSYQAHYNGDANYPAGEGACEPLSVSTTLPCPAGSFTPRIAANGDLNIVYDQFPAPNDNSYGANAVGWGTKGHTFGNLVGSDHAGFQLVDQNGVVRLDFSIDYLSASAGTPSGYKSLGPFGGDGRVNVGTLTPADLTFDTSLARNLNDTGYFAGGVQVVGNAVANLLVDSPPTLNTTNSYVLTPAAAAVFTAPNPDSAQSPGWNFHDTYFVTIKAAKLAALGFDAATWKVQPNADELHNSPAKPCPCPTPAPDPNPVLSQQDVTVNGQPAVEFIYTQSLAVNDNSYGANTIGWDGKAHTFSNLTGSDKAEFEIVNSATGATVFDFFVDYLSATPASAQFPSGYRSLGPFGGDGSFATGNQAAILSWTTSLEQNQNNVNVPGLFNPPGTQALSPGNPNVLVDSPPGTADESAANPPFTGWDYKSVYRVTILKSALPASYTWSVPAVHNSPAKPATPCPPAGGNQCNLTVTKTEVKDKQVKITIQNNASVDAIISALSLTWPEATNGKVTQIKLDGDVIYDNPDLAGGTASLTTAQLVADPNKRKINHGSSDVLTFIFENNADTNLAHYASILSFGSGCDLTILP